MIITSHLFDAYLKCPTKCWLRSREDLSAGNGYADSVCAENEAYRAEESERLLSSFPESDRAITSPGLQNLNDASWRIAIDVRLCVHDLEARLQAIERIPSDGRRRPAQFIPYRFEFANKLSKYDKLSLAFDAFLLSEVLGRKVVLGKIVHGDRRTTLKVQISPLAGEVRERIKKIGVLVSATAPPDLVLNRHCGECEFQARCRRQAMEKDDLSLLSGMSEKERKKLHGKGIFTVTQLSYTFRPRRRHRESQAKQGKFHHSLRALAIREKKIHAVDLPDPKLEGTPVYLDVEGLPDRDLYYLVGLRVGTRDGAVQYSFWANDADGEKQIWNEFLDVLSAIPDPRLVHYGSYETVFLKQMRKRYGGPREGSAAATAIEHAVNLLSFVFARIYFPTFSNGLKEITGYLGFRWSASPVSGLEAIVWRHRWEATRDFATKQALVDYNQQDCEALELLANRLVELCRAAPSQGTSSQSEVVRTSDIKHETPYRFKRNAFVFPDMETINKAAYWDYQRDRVYVKSRKKTTRESGRHSRRRSALMPNTTVECPRASSCPTCRSNLVYRHGKRSKIVIDLRFMQHGIKRWITRYVVQRYRCLSCRSTFYPCDRGWTASKYGPNLAAYTVYQNIELGLPQSRVASSVKQLFGLYISRNTANRFKAATAEKYTRAYDDLLERLSRGHLLHVDETSASVMGRDSYVWVLTSMDEVAYVYAPTREGSTIQTLLKHFSGGRISTPHTTLSSARSRNA